MMAKINTCDCDLTAGCPKCNPELHNERIVHLPSRHIATAKEMDKELKAKDKEIDRLKKDYDKLSKSRDRMIDENDNLKKQLKDIQYLDAKEVEEVFNEHGIFVNDCEDVKYFINSILSLAIPDGVVVAEGEIEELTHSQIDKTYTARIKNITHYDIVDDDEGLFKLILIKK